MSYLLRYTVKGNNISLVVVFFILLGSVSLGSVLRMDPTPILQENRELAAFPAISKSVNSIIGFPEKYNLYFNDNFGFRRLLIRLHGQLMVDVYKSSPNPTVIVGKEGWLFLASNFNLEYYQAKTLFSDEELFEWKQILESNRNILASRGIRQIIIIAPNKDTIYPEYMPDNISQYRDVSRMDQLLDYLQRTTDVQIIDLRSEMIEAKKTIQVYTSAESHWNDMGAYIAYKEILDNARIWFPLLTPMPLSAFEMSYSNEGYFDLINMIGLSGSLDTERLSLFPKSESKAFIVDSGILPSSVKLNLRYLPVTYSTGDASLPRVVVFHDSFADWLKPLLPQNFQTTSFYHSFYYNEVESPNEIIDRENPDLVIIEFAERFLQNGINMIRFADLKQN